MVLVEARHIDGGSNHWVDSIDGGFGQLMHDLVMMVMVDLVMIRRDRLDAIKRCSTRVESTTVII